MHKPGPNLGFLLAKATGFVPDRELHKMEAAPGITTSTGLAGHSLEGTSRKHPLEEGVINAGFTRVLTLKEASGEAHHYSDGAGTSLKLTADGQFHIAGKGGIQRGASGKEFAAARDKDNAAKRVAEGTDNHAYRGWDTRRTKARESD